ncbi:MAG: flavoprotein [Clostridium tyrobutyricum]|jgi:phosphopantothenoylcysteine synthetase/decarboxylase|uniref:flavoprotein n=1 Tax=Clostridium tyrobutyricum TaxID=1519 RepID=UPI0018AC447E|nr:flavoprotein [Clostridium tyrobutyricum]MBR9648945.1 flavoprotein [Clostridium tyrobutyricum]MCH4257759.1 flavoprotein [Clostridium tyrobutyricum]MCI1237971.1 flavoprotein [Clostridium tyrobutyricum]MCI1651684.1 flavoprotein [Clostridium tyrobutyricum]MCI1936481.1 flavoprotein [Clostridium tyrobutyricum]
MLDGKKIVVGITGCSAAIKTLDVISRLKKLHADVYASMTENSTNFITPLMVQRSVDHPIEIEAFDLPKSWEKGHKSLSKDVDLLLIAPASANILGKAANGIADDLLSTIIMSTRTPKVIATHINNKMYNSPSVQRNVKTLIGDGFTFVDNGNKEYPSIFPSVDQIVDTVVRVLDAQA